MPEYFLFEEDPNRDSFTHDLVDVLDAEDRSDAVKKALDRHRVKRGGRFRILNLSDSMLFDVSSSVTINEEHD